MTYAQPDTIQDIGFDTDLSLDIIVSEELEKMPACEGGTHAAALWGHVPADPAAYLVIMPCGANWHACAGWVGYVTRGIYCINVPGTCGGTHDLPEMTFIPLDLKG